MYQQITLIGNLGNAAEMRDAWVADVQRRVAGKAAGVPVEENESELVAA